MAVSRAMFGLITLLVVLATLWLAMNAAFAGGGSHSTPGLATPSAPPAQAYGNAINSAQSAVQQANQDAQRAAGTSVGP